MKLLGQILLVCIIISALQALVAAIALAIMLLLIWGLLYRTSETVGLIAFCLLIKAFQVHPLVTIGLVALFAGALLIAQAKTSDPVDPQKLIALLPHSNPPD